MKKINSLILLSVVSSFLGSCNKNEKEEKPKAVVSQRELIKRGSYLVSAIGCSDCHTTKIFTPTGPVPDTSRLLSGYVQNEKLPEMSEDALKKGWILFNSSLTAVVGPWGISFSANLTPHDTGIGNWTADQFKTALRQGKYKGLAGSRDLLPPMPWHAYRNLTDEDILAVFSYLKTIKPIDNLVPTAVPPTEIFKSDGK